jgi:hypothetical protein
VGFPGRKVHRKVRAVIAAAVGIIEKIGDPIDKVFKGKVEAFT